MNINQFIQGNIDDIEKYVDGELDEIADCFYNFAHGFYDLDEIGYPEKHLENIVSDEYNREGGILKKHFDIIYKLEGRLQNFEKHICKNKRYFNPDESMVGKLRAEYQDLIQEFSKKMFLYGVKFGTRLNRKI